MYDGSIAHAYTLGCDDWMADVLACRYIIAAPLEKLYGFTVNEEILDELERLLRAYLHRYVEKKMKTLQILDLMK